MHGQISDSEKYTSCELFFKVNFFLQTFDPKLFGGPVYESEIRFPKLTLADPIWRVKYVVPNFKNISHFGAKLYTEVFGVNGHESVV